jgi:hypothetical protein
MMDGLSNYQAINNIQVSIAIVLLLIFFVEGWDDQILRLNT